MSPSPRAHHPERGHELYVARPRPVLTVMHYVMTGVVTVVGLAVLAVYAVGIVAASRDPSLPGGERTTIVTFLGVQGVLLLMLLIPLVVSSLRSARMAMRVTTAGIEVRGYLRDRWIPWEQVARVETSDHWYWRGATRIVRCTGEPVTSIVTTYRYYLFRDEPYDAAARDPRIPQLPTRAAIDAHRRYLRGEFGGV